MRLAAANKLVELGIEDMESLPLLVEIFGNELNSYDQLRAAETLIALYKQCENNEHRKKIIEYEGTIPKWCEHVDRIDDDYCQEEYSCGNITLNFRKGFVKTSK